MVISSQVDSRRTITKFPEIYHTRAEPLFYICIFDAFLAAVIVVVCLRIASWIDKCWLKSVNFNLFSFLFQPFATAPYVFVTAVHPVTNKHDAASVWAEDITRYNFRACLRELKNFDGAHQYLSVVRIRLKIIKTSKIVEMNEVFLKRQECSNVVVYSSRCK